ncbi:MAG: universal stress protein [Vicingaceae bacterium]|nr:universal stress protein [Vicingaceae bacterium]
MKRILIPTDFSDAANRARDYALNIADLLNAEVFLINTYHIPHAGATMAVNVDALARDSSQEEMDKQLEYLKLNFPEIDVRSKCIAGLFVDTIKRVVEVESIDLVVMGTTGTSGVVENFLGSNASALIGSIDTPIITVPGDTVINFPEKIVVANDLTDSGEDQIFNVLKQIVGNTKASLDFLFIVDEEEKANTKIERLKAASFDEAFDAAYHPFHFRESDNVEDGILDYIDGKQFDLLVVVCHQRNFWERIWERSISKSLVKHAQIPILVLTD